MIRALLRDSTGAQPPVVLLGLDDTNLRRIRDGEPIRVNLRRLDPNGPETDLPDVDVVVYFSEEENDALLSIIDDATRAQAAEAAEPFSSYLAPRKVLPDGRVVDVAPLLFHRARLTISENTETQTITDAWEYDRPIPAVAAAAEWDGHGEPIGWSLHPASGRRRPGGDPSLEYVRP